MLIERAAMAMAALSLLVGAAPARAQDLAGSTPQPQTRIVAPCTAKPPEVGQVFRGAVLQVLDGRTVCVAQGPDPQSWVQVSISAIPRESSRAVMMAAAFAKPVACVVDRESGAEAVAHCVVGGKPLSDLVSDGAVIKASLDWR